MYLSRIGRIASSVVVGSETAGGAGELVDSFDFNGHCIGKSGMARTLLINSSWRLNFDGSRIEERVFFRVSPPTTGGPSIALTKTRSAAR